MTTRFMTDPDAMRAMAGRFEAHAQAVEDEARRMSVASLDPMSQTNTAFRNIVNMLHGVRDGLVRDANRYEQQEHDPLMRGQTASLEAEHQAIVRDVLAAGDFWGGAGSVACQEFIAQLGRNFQVIYEQAN